MYIRKHTSCSTAVLSRLGGSSASVASYKKPISKLLEHAVAQKSQTLSPALKLVYLRFSAQYRAMTQEKAINLVAEARHSILKTIDLSVENSVLTNKSPTLIAVSKRQPIEQITAAIEAGQLIFGENQIQETIAKWPELKKSYSDIELHLIGPLQSNKTREAVALFGVIHTVDREKIARAIKAECDKQNKEIRCLIQINTGSEPQKAGINPNKTGDFLSLCRDEIGLNIVGLMCIPPADENPAPHFALLYKLAKEHNLPELSMGMSGDYEIATQLGATYVRVGSALFGERRT